MATAGSQALSTEREGLESRDLSKFPDISFAEVESFPQKASGCDHTRKAYKFFAEPGYLHDKKLQYSANHVKVTSKCYRSMKKSEPPHKLSVQVGIADKSICGKCSCVAGASGYCHHVVGLLFYMSHCKHLGLKSLPDELTCTSLPQMWSVPRQKKIANKAIQDVMVKKPQSGADYTKFVKSTLYSPTTAYPLMHSDIMTSLKPQPLMATVLPPASKMTSISPVATSFGNAAQGSVLSYQQKLSKEYIINDYSCTFFPDLPLETAVERFTNVPVCLSAEKQAALDSLGVTRDTAIKLEQQTISQSNNETWYHLREKRMTASKFGKVAKRKTNFESLVTQLNPSRRVVTADMQRGIVMEPVAAMAYANIAKQGKVNLFPSGLIINPRSHGLVAHQTGKYMTVQLRRMVTSHLDFSKPKLSRKAQLILMEYLIFTKTLLLSSCH